MMSVHERGNKPPEPVQNQSLTEVEEGAGDADTQEKTKKLQCILEEDDYDASDTLDPNVPDIKKLAEEVG